MSISQDDIIQTQTGSWNAIGGNVTLPSGTTDGNTVVIAIMVGAANNPLIAGFTRTHGSCIGNVRPYLLQKQNVPAGETSWAMTGPVGAVPTVWVAMEIRGLSELAAVETWATPNATAQTGTSVATATTPPSYSYETLCLAIYGGTNSASSTVPVFTGHTGDFTEFATSSRVDGATANAISVGVVTGIEPDTYQSTVTSSVTLSAANASMVVYNAVAARRVPNVDVMAGMEWGTAAGIATGVTGAPPFDAVAGSVAVVTTTPRTGTYCLQLSGTGAAASVAWTSTGAMSHYPVTLGYVIHRQYVGRFSFRFPSALPGTDVRIAAIDNNTGTSGAGVQIMYRSSGTRIGVQVSQDATHIGTEVFSATTVVADTWYSIDVYLDMTNRNREQKHHAYWQLDGVEQAEAFATTDTPTAVNTFTRWTLGWSTATTATILYDDLAGAKHPGSYPLGDIGIYGLPVDPAGTVTVTTPASFSTFTNNGTLNSTFNTTTARNAVDELPPTVGASADGLLQDTVGTGDYVQVPMSTRDVYTNLGALRGLRWHFCGWSSSTGPTAGATLGFRGWDGAAETILFAAAEPNFQNSTTAPSWVSRMHRTLASSVPYALTQAKLDALEARIGFSSDATPTIAGGIGVHNICVEAAIRAAIEQQIMQVEETLYVYAVLDPDTSNYIALRLVAPPDADAKIIYRVDGVMQTPAPIAAGTEFTYVIGAESNATVDYVTAERV